MWDSGTGPKSVTREVRRCGQLWAVICLSQLPSNYSGLSTGARKRHSPITPADTGRGQWEKTLRRSVSTLGHMGDMMAVMRAGWSPEPLTTSFTPVFGAYQDQPPPGALSPHAQCRGEPSEAGSSPPTLHGLPSYDTDVNLTRSLSRGWKSRFSASAAAEVAFLPTKDGVPDRWDRKVLRSLCLQLSPSPFPQQIKGKSATITTTSQPDASEIPGVSTVLCAQPTRLCKGLSSPQGSVRKNPSRKEQVGPRSLQKAGSPGATEAPLPLKTLPST